MSIQTPSRLASYDQPAKNQARSYLYNEFLPAVLSGSRIRNGFYLVLPGAEALELEILKDLEVNPRNVVGIENHGVTFWLMKQRIAELNYPVALSYSSEQDWGVAQYLTHQLRSNRFFTMLNLDIEGQFSSQLYDCFTDVLLYCYRRPETVVATYYTSGRTRTDINQGLITLGMLTSMGYGEIFKALKHRFGQFVTADTTSTNQALRMLYWWRAHLDHLIRAEVISGRLPREAVSQYFDYLKGIWKLIRELPGPVITESQIAALDYSVLPKLGDINIGVNLGRLDMLFYYGTGTFIQNCFFAKYDHLDKLQALPDWLSESAQRISCARIAFIDEQGGINDSIDPHVVQQDIKSLDDEVVWQNAPKRNDLLTFSPVFPGIPAYDPLVAMEIGESMGQTTRQEEVTHQEETMSTRSVAVVIETATDKREEIITLHNQGYSASEIVNELGLQSDMVTSVRAIKANATRKSWHEEDQMKQVRKLAASGKNTNEIVRELGLPASMRRRVGSVVGAVTRQKTK